MIEEPNFDYHYDLAFRKSFAARLSLAILVIAAGIFLVAMLVFLKFAEDNVRDITTINARGQLHEAVVDMRQGYERAVLHGLRPDSDSIVSRLMRVRPYSHSYTLLVGHDSEVMYLGNKELLDIPQEDARQVLAMITSGKRGMDIISKGTSPSLIIYEPVTPDGPYAAVVCTRADVLSSYTSLIVYVAAFFVLGLFVLFACCAYAIYRMARPLHDFADTAMSIADGNLDTPLPEINTEDELRRLKDSFAYMQTSLKQYIEDLKVTTATKEHMQSELTIAHDIQMGMLPTDFPEHDTIDLYAHMEPAKQVGGDLYDFLIDNDQLFFIVGDVAGKGVPASLYMAVTRTLFRNLAGNYQSAANVVREINHAIATTNDSCTFVTLLVGVLDLRANVLSLCNAAHCRPVVMHQGKEPFFVDLRPNVPVGVVDHYAYTEQQLDFAPGSSLLLYTDGLTEAVNPTHELFGEQRLLSDAALCSSTTARDAVSFVRRRVNAFADGTEQSDDLTLLFLRHKDHDVDFPDTSRIRLKNELSEVGRMSSFIFSVCRRYGADESWAMSVNLAIEEAVVNVINYAYPKGTRGSVEILATASDGVMTLTLKDYGVPFDPTQAAHVDTDAPAEERRIGGLGIHLVRSIMDTMSYQRTDDGANVLVLTKIINGES